MCQHEMLLPEVQLGLNLISKAVCKELLKEKRKTEGKKHPHTQNTKKLKNLIRGGVISYVVVTSFSVIV